MTAWTRARAGSVPRGAAEEGALEAVGAEWTGRKESSGGGTRGGDRVRGVGRRRGRGAEEDDDEAAGADRIGADARAAVDAPGKSSEERGGRRGRGSGSGSDGGGGERCVQSSRGGRADPGGVSTDMKPLQRERAAPLCLDTRPGRLASGGGAGPPGRAGTALGGAAAAEPSCGLRPRIRQHCGLLSSIANAYATALYV